MGTVENNECAFCFAEPEHWFQHTETNKIISLCAKCRELLRASLSEGDNVTSDVTQDDNSLGVGIAEQPDRPPAEERPDEARRLVPGRCGGNALVWKEIGTTYRGLHILEAKAVAKAVYTIAPRTEYSASGFRRLSGYHVMHWPAGIGIDVPRSLGTDVETVEKAKAIAQADHDEGKDAR